MGTAVSPGRRSCIVSLDSGETVECRVAPSIAADRRAALAVGDRVQVDRGPRDARGVIRSVLPRRSVLSRPSPTRAGASQQVIAANVDVVVVVMAPREPPLRTRLVDRILIAVEQGGARPVLCVNKWDLACQAEGGIAELEVRLAPYSGLGLPVVQCSAIAREDAGVATLAHRLAGETAVLVGPSGTGKSSLINALIPGAGRSTGAIATGTGKGRHTTTRAALHRGADGTAIVDTPGIREFGLWQVDRSGLRGHFREFHEHASDCRFRNCQHRNEPSCAVRSAAESGLLAPARYESYLRLLNEVEP